jgi:hypothetical protein
MWLGGQRDKVSSRSLIGASSGFSTGSHLSLVLTTPTWKMTHEAQPCLYVLKCRSVRDSAPQPQIMLCMIECMFLACLFFLHFHSIVIISNQND